MGVDANRPEHGPAAKESASLKPKFEQQIGEIAPKVGGKNGHYKPGDAPSQVLLWATKAVAKAGTLSIVGVYPMAANAFPIGAAMNRNLTIRMVNCNHRAYEPKLVRLVATGAFDPTKILTKHEPVADAIDAYAAFDTRDPGWLKVGLDPRTGSAVVNPDDEDSPDPRERGTLPAQDVDPAAGVSDDPRVDPTPDRRHSDADGGTRRDL